MHGFKGLTSLGVVIVVVRHSGSISIRESSVQLVALKVVYNESDNGDVALIVLFQP